MSTIANTPTTEPLTDALPEEANRDLVGRSLKTLGAGNAVDVRSLALLRCMIAVSAMLTNWITPEGTPQLSVVAHISFALYFLYSIAVAVVSYSSDWKIPPKALYWIDVICFAWLVALTYTSSNSLYQCFFYPVFVASFTKGFLEGFWVTFTVYVLMIVIGMGFSVTGGQFGYGHSNTIMQADFFFIVGYLIAYCGGYGGLLMRKLALLKEVNSLWHPRISVAEVYGKNLDRLLEFFNGNTCILVLQKQSPEPNFVMYSTYRDKPGRSAATQNVAEGAAKTLLDTLPNKLAAYYHEPVGSLLRKFRNYHAYDIDSEVITKAYQKECASLANLLDTKVFMTVPYIQHGRTTGRFFLATDAGNFNSADLDFLSQASNAFSMLVEGMHLVEDLTNKAAEHERSNISRDLHDTTIQPYIGLKLALEALGREAEKDNVLAHRIKELIEMAEMTIVDLRDFAATIKGKAAMPGEAMIEAIVTQAERLNRYHGIKVSITSEITKQLKGRDAAELFQIISEGLSNILRHTQAKNAYVSVICKASELQLEIGNDEAKSIGFTPKSIFERVRILGGTAQVEHRPTHHTVISITLPLS